MIYGGTAVWKYSCVTRMTTATTTANVKVKEKAKGNNTRKNTIVTVLSLILK